MAADPTPVPLIMWEKRQTEERGQEEEGGLRVSRGRAQTAPTRKTSLVSLVSSAGLKGVEEVSEVVLTIQRETLYTHSPSEKQLLTSPS